MNLQSEFIKFTTTYRAKNGLGKLNEWDTTRDPQGIESCGNDNGILFMAYPAAMFEIHGVRMDVTDLNTTIQSLQEKPGLFNRKPGQNTKREAHDNYVALSYFSVVYGLRFIKQICAHGEAWGWNFNNEPPYEWKIEAQRQGGEIAFYKICNSDVPAPWETLWLLAGILKGCLDAFSGKQKGQTQLLWLRLLTLDKCNPTPFWARALYVFFMWCVRRGFGSFHGLWDYPTDSDPRMVPAVDHPTRVLSKEIS